MQLLRYKEYNDEKKRKKSNMIVNFFLNKSIFENYCKKKLHLVVKKK